jgi:hypothetical protein
LTPSLPRINPTVSDQAAHTFFAILLLSYQLFKTRLAGQFSQDFRQKIEIIFQAKPIG